MPNPYVRKMPATWWLKRPAYFWFMMREFSSVFIGVYSVILLVMVARVKAGATAFDGFVAALQSPVAIVFHLVALLFAVLHSATWFNATPKAMVIRRGEEKVPPALMIASNYVAWVVLSAILMWLVLG